MLWCSCFPEGSGGHDHYGREADRGHVIGAVAENLHVCDPQVLVRKRVNWEWCGLFKAQIPPSVTNHRQLGHPF